MWWRLFLLLTLLAHPVEAQVTRVSAASTTAASTSTVNLSVDSGSGSNRYLLCWLGQRNASISTFTYAGVAMTQLAADTTVGSLTLHMYGLLAPATGINTVAVVLGTSPTQIGLGCATYSGVDQTTPNSGTGTKTSGNFGTTCTSCITGSVTSSASGMVVGGVWAERSTTGTLTEGQTLETEQESVLSNLRMFGIASTPGDGTSKAISWSATGIASGENWRESLINLNAAAVPGTGSQQPRRRIVQ